MSTPARSLTRRFSPQRKICEVPRQAVQQALINIFQKWGVPKWIKVDNGRPFGDPQREVVPLLALWLIGLGIQVIWNRPRTPQDNAKVERSQGVLATWTELDKCQNTHDLQVRLQQAAHFHNYHFPIRRLQKRKRIEVFPALAFSGRPWSAADFQLQRVLTFLAKGNWERKVAPNGQVTIYRQRLQVGLSRKHQQVSIKLCPKHNVWQVFDAAGILLKTQPTPFTEQSIWQLDLA